MQYKKGYCCIFLSKIGQVIDRVIENEYYTEIFRRK